MITALLFLTYILFSFGQVGRVSFINQQINVYLYELLLILFFIFLFIKYRFKPLFSSYKHFKWIFFFLLILLISFSLTIFKYDLIKNLIGFLYYCRLCFYFIFFFYLTYYLKREKKAEKIVKKGIIIITFITVIAAMFQYLFYPDLRNLLYLGWDPHFYRAFGVFFDTSIAGAVFGLLFFREFGGFRGVGDIRGIGGLFKILLSLCLFILILLTYSRSLYLVFAITFFIILLKNLSIKKIVISLAILVLLIIFFPKPVGEGGNLARLFSVNSRLNDYKAAFDVWTKSPILGVGYNRLRYIKENMGLVIKDEVTHAGFSFHSSYLIVLATSGVLGLLGLLGVLGILARTSYLSKIYLIFIGLLSLTDNVLLHPFVMFLLFNLIAVEIIHPSHT